MNEITRQWRTQAECGEYIFKKGSYLRENLTLYIKKKFIQTLFKG